ncbi:hypothetical protein KSC_087330 [Ktedonobacter sp. SOSP1-52]|nr:hypothetical protein KSC_087330 [Ktedonobacter sp. SOSP1-52]
MLNLEAQKARLEVKTCPLFGPITTYGGVGAPNVVEVLTYTSGRPYQKDRTFQLLVVG